jgi:hypothetical protein
MGSFSQNSFYIPPFFAVFAQTLGQFPQNVGFCPDFLYIAHLEVSRKSGPGRTNLPKNRFLDETIVTSIQHLCHLAEARWSCLSRNRFIF